MKFNLILFSIAAFLFVRPLESAAIGKHSQSLQDAQILRLHSDQLRPLLKSVQSLHLDIAGVDWHQGSIDIVVPKTQLDYFRDYFDVSSEVIVTPSSIDHRYTNPANASLAMENFASLFSEICTLEEIGRSHEGRPIHALKMTLNADHGAAKPAILFNAMHHAREIMTTEVIMDTIEYLIDHHNSDAKVRSWLENYEIWLVPMLNPDGSNKVWSQQNMWRKNTRGGYGVDLNRNYPHRWNGCNGSSGSQYESDYRGPSPGSEPETQALMNLVARIKPVFGISYHSFSEMVLYPFGCRSERLPQNSSVARIGSQMAKLLTSDVSSGHTYSAGTPYELLYEADGGDIDWMYSAHNVMPYVIEINSRREGFQPDYDQWRNRTVGKMRKAWQFLLDQMSTSVISLKLPEDFEGTSKGLRMVVESLDSPETLKLEIKPKEDGSFHWYAEDGVFSYTLFDGQQVIYQDTISKDHSSIRAHLEL